MGKQEGDRESPEETAPEPRGEPETSPASHGGRALVNKYGTKHMAEIGRKGSQAVVKKYGLRFYSEIASRNRGVKKRRAAEKGQE